MKNDIIVDQFSPNEFIYLVDNGEFKVQKIIKNDKNGCYYKGFGNLQIDKITSVLKDRVFAIDLCAKGEILCEDILFSDRATSETSVICNSANGSVFSIKMSFFKFFGEKIYTFFKNNFEWKKNHRVKHFQDSIKTALKYAMNENNNMKIFDFDPNFSTQNKFGNLPLNFLEEIQNINFRMKSLQKIRNLKLKTLNAGWEDLTSEQVTYKPRKSILGILQHKLKNGLSLKKDHLYAYDKSQLDVMTQENRIKKIENERTNHLFLQVKKLVNFTTIS